MQLINAVKLFAKIMIKILRKKRRFTYYEQFIQFQSSSKEVDFQQKLQNLLLNSTNVSLLGVAQPQGNG